MSEPETSNRRIHGARTLRRVFTTLAILLLLVLAGVFAKSPHLTRPTVSVVSLQKGPIFGCGSYTVFYCWTIFNVTLSVNNLDRGAFIASWRFQLCSKISDCTYNWNFTLPGIPSGAVPTGNSVPAVTPLGWEGNFMARDQNVPRDIDFPFSPFWRGQGVFTAVERAYFIEREAGLGFTLNVLQNQSPYGYVADFALTYQIYDRNTKLLGSGTLHFDA